MLVLLLCEIESPTDAYRHAVGQRLPFALALGDAIIYQAQRPLMNGLKVIPPRSGPLFQKEIQTQQKLGPGSQRHHL